MTDTFTRAWNYNSEVRVCETCNGLGVIAHPTRRPTIDDPYPESPCPDCEGEHGPECEVCGFGQDVLGFDCLACDTIASLRDGDFAALNDAAFAAAIMRAAAQRRKQEQPA